jgi:hypothetical protein
MDAMSLKAGELLGRVALLFDSGSDFVPEELSAAARGPDHTFWFAADERAALERLAPMAPHGHELGKHHCFPLSDALGIGEEEEVDIEGLALDEKSSALWMIGSHSAKRKKPRGDGHRADLERLATVETEGARFVLGRIEIDERKPRLEGKKHGPLMLPSSGEGSLIAMLEGDEHLAPFLPAATKKKRKKQDGGDERAPIPGKDNGFDIEGLAFFDGRLLIGLRGPVLRGWAFVIDIELEPRDGALEARGKGRKYRKHALDVDGLGVRELIVDGDDVLVLAGPTMALDGAHRLYRWKGGPRSKRDSVVEQGDKKGLTPMFDLPWGPGVDRAEGIARFDWFDEDDSILVVYDSPRKSRRLGKSGVLADVFALG